MSERGRGRLSESEFFDWLATQERRHELVGGEAVMMAGADARHDTIVVNVLLSLGGKLRGTPCRVFTADTAIRIPNGNIRYPDVSVDCGRREDRSRTAASPTVVVEVLSPSTRAFDREDKLEEYKSVPTMAHIVLIDPDEPETRLFACAADGSWRVDRIGGLENVLELPAVAAALPLAAVYEGLELRPRPKLVVRSDVEAE